MAARELEQGRAAADAGQHGIFDFIHRNPDNQCAPYYSAAETPQRKAFWRDMTRSARILSLHSTFGQPMSALGG